MKTGQKHPPQFRRAKAGEIVRHLRHAAENYYLRRQIQKKRFKLKVPEVSRGEIDTLKLPALNGAVTDSQVIRILQGGAYRLSTKNADIQKLENNFRHTFCADIPIGSSDTDIRAVWEPARLQHITMLLSCLIQNPGNSMLEAFAKNAVLKWIADNPFLKGPHFMSAAECALRIPVLFYCLKIVDSLSDGEYRLILRTIYEHAWWVSRRLSLFSSIGNKTICEGAGLVFAGTVFNFSVRGGKWFKHGLSILEQELEHQILDDGGPAEQSFGYHRLILDIYWLTLNFLEKNRLAKSSMFLKKLALGEAFIGVFQELRGSYPSIGDSDNGYAVAPTMVPERQGADTLPLTSLRMERDDQTASISLQIDRFDTSGYTIIKAEYGLHVIFDHGPLGMAPLYSHGHADALSVVLSRSGVPILVDSGTYRYNTDSVWRRYFKGTRAHNTVTIDDMDQAEQKTSFSWSHPFTVDLKKNIEIKKGYFIQATHNGYQRLTHPVFHTRSIVWFDEFNFVIKDSFTGEGNHTFELNFHFHPKAVLIEKGSWWIVTCAKERAFIRLLGKNTFAQISGQTNPILGWYSPSYGIKRECPVLTCRREGVSDEISFLTAICLGLPVKADELHARLLQIEQQVAES